MITVQVSTTLLATLSSGSLTIADTDATGKNNSLSLVRTNVSGTDYLEITDSAEQFGSAPATTPASSLQNGGKTLRIPLSAVTGSLTFDTAGGNDTLTVDLAGGDAIPAGNILFAGGNPTTGPGDKLVITGGNQGTVTYGYSNTSSHDGSVAMSAFGTITYTGLEPITNTGTATDIIFNLPAGPNTAILGDDGNTGNTLSRLTSPTLEQTDFANPTGSLTINRGSTTDTLTVNALPNFNAGLTIGSAAGPFATVNLSGAVTLAAGNSLAAAATNLNVTGSGTHRLRRDQPGGRQRRSELYRHADCGWKRFDRNCHGQPPD